MALEVDETDKRIIYELDKNARIPEVKLAKIIGKSKESIRYRIKKLLDQKIILGFTTWIDPTKLGYKTEKVYLNLANIPAKKEEFLEYVKKDKRLFWLGVAEGAWNIGLTYFVKSPEEFFNLKNDLFSRFKNLIIENKTAAVVSIHYHEQTFLHRGEAQWETMFEESQNIELDKVSKKILKSLFKNSRENVATMAYENNTTVDIVRNRIKRMEEQRIIKKYTSVIDYEKLGYEFFKTFLYFKSLNEKELSRLMDYALNNENIIHLVKAISPWDIELETRCKNFSAYNAVISSLTKEFSKNIQKVETAIMGQDYIFPAERMVFE